jgi:hypothetical protein
MKIGCMNKIVPSYDLKHPSCLKVKSTKYFLNNNYVNFSMFNENLHKFKDCFSVEICNFITV